MLRHLTQGMAEAGAQVETVHLREKKINSCIGCYTCWTKTPGQCLHKDDMSLELLPEMLKSDIAVYATPLYNRLMTSGMKTFIERTLPAYLPYFEQQKGRSHHPLRDTYPDVAILSVAGFPELAEFSILSTCMQYNYGEYGRKLLAEIYRPGAEAMATPVFKDKLEAILAATVQAGRQLVTSGRVSPETLKTIQQSLCPREDLARIANAHWKTCIQNRMTPKAMSTKGIMPRPDSIEAYLSFLKVGFLPEAAAGLDAVMTFNFDDDPQKTCHLQFKDGSMTALMGSAVTSDLTVNTPFELWMDITTGVADGQQTFMEQKYTIEGDFNLLLRFRELFGK